MPRYFFHFFDGEITQDAEGVVLRDAEEAILRASREARAMAAVAVRETGKLHRDHYVFVTDTAGNEVTQVFFGDVVVLVGKPRTS
jgi:hypothetical protein